jgi:thioredoxin reductase (NADPH)
MIMPPITHIAAGEPIPAEVLIIGAGPCGLFQVFELGLLGIKAHVVDSLQHPGGQCAELYPEKPIYDIPAVPVCSAQELIDRLLLQIKPFNAQIHLGQEVSELARQTNGRFLVKTSTGASFDAGAIVIAAGVGSFQPRRMALAGCDALEGHSIHYHVRNASQFDGKELVIFGGGDSAIDWTLQLAPRASSLTLVHRREVFRAAPASVAKMRELAAVGRIRYIEGHAQGLVSEGNALQGIRVTGVDGTVHSIAAEHLLVFFGLHPKLGPIAEWGLQIERKALQVDTERFSTSVPGIFAIGDINTYPGKKKLILSGFHEAALAAFGIQQHLYPEKRQFLQYTTTSPAMHKRLGVAEPSGDSLAG